MNAISRVEDHGRRIAADLVLTEGLNGDNEEETILLRKMADEARNYISSFSWCTAILDSYFGTGVGGIFAVFFFHIRPSRPGVDPWIWIVVGDIPSAYLPVSDCKSPAEVFETYVRGVKRWVEWARRGATGAREQDVPPLNMPATPEWAERLSQRIDTLALIIAPFFKNESETVN